MTIGYFLPATSATFASESLKGSDAATPPDPKACAPKAPKVHEWLVAHIARSQRI